ncbi:MAG: hypothetical protein M3O71_13355 [Bacteroidota bacterium]|nr:hypothetical protein [Bacteroidota bacterium]
MNDTIQWGGNDVGFPGEPLVKVYGIAESTICPFCGFQNDEEYDITLKADIISAMNLMESYNPYTSSGNEGGYFTPDI